VDESSQGIAVHVQGLGGPELVPLLFPQDCEDEDLLKLTDCLGVQNPSLMHPQYEILEVILQGKPSSPALDRIVLGVNEIPRPLSGLLSVACAFMAGGWQEMVQSQVGGCQGALSLWVAALLVTLPSLSCCGNLAHATAGESRGGAKPY